MFIVQCYVAGLSFCLFVCLNLTCIATPEIDGLQVTPSGLQT